MDYLTFNVVLFRASNLQIEPGMLNTQSGQSYIELLIATLLVGLSMTGMVVLMLSSQQLSRQTIQHSDVVQLVSNYSNQLRLNPAELRRTSSQYLTSINATGEIAVHCSATANCAQQQQALKDLKDWQLQLSQHLPYYTATMCRDSSILDGEPFVSDGCDDAPSSPLVIKLWWKNQQSSTEHVQFYAIGHAL